MSPKEQMFLHQCLIWPIDAIMVFERWVHEKYGIRRSRSKSRLGMINYFWYSKTAYMKITSIAFYQVSIECNLYFHWPVCNLQTLYLFASRCKRIQLMFLNGASLASFSFIFVFWNKFMWKMSIQYMTLGFKPTIFRTWVSYHKH